MNKIIILAIVFAGLSGVGILGTSFFIDIQPLGLFSTLDELPGSICSCADSEGNFSPENCDQFMGDYSDSPDAVCQQLAPLEDYGDPPLQTQGCSADFWQSGEIGTDPSSVWPAGYSPDYYYNEMFQVTITIPVQEDTKVIGGTQSTSIVNDSVESGNATESIALEPLGNTTGSDPKVIEDEVLINKTNNDLSAPDMGINLVEALDLEGTQLNDLLRESVTAMLNAAHSDINYPYSVSDIITMTQIALANEDYNDTVKILKEANDRGNTPICNA
jgi:hypothetical protein